MATQPPVPTQQPPQAAQPRPRRRTTAEIMQEADDWWLQLRRSLAGYNSLNGAYRVLAGETSPEERVKALPVFEFSATANGRDAVKVAVDLKKVEQQYVPHVLVPLINSLGTEMQEALEEIEIRVQELKKVLAPQQPPSPAPNGGGDPEE